MCLFQLVNNGPSIVSQATLEVRCPRRAVGHMLLYPVEVVTEGPLSCSFTHTFNALKLKVRKHTRGMVGMAKPLALLYSWPWTFDCICKWLCQCLYVCSSSLLQQRVPRHWNPALSITSGGGSCTETLWLNKETWWENMERTGNPFLINIWECVFLPAVLIQHLVNQYKTTTHIKVNFI